MQLTKISHCFGRHELQAIQTVMAELKAGEGRLMAKNAALRAYMAEVRAENDEMR